MRKYFYSHLIEIESIELELNRIDLKEEEKKELLFLCESNLYHLIIDLILSSLSLEDKKEFLKVLSENDHEKIWKHLKFKIADIEKKIRKTAEELRDEFYRDIQEAKEKHKKEKILKNI